MKNKPQKNKTLIILSTIIIIFLIIGSVYYFKTLNIQDNNSQKTPEQNPQETNKEQTPEQIPEQTSSIKGIYPDEANRLIKSTPEIIILDVSSRYESGHIPNAINYPIADSSFDNKINTLDKNKIYLVYGFTDSESRNAAKKMTEIGFKTLYQLKGSYGLWLDYGYKIEK